MASRDSNTFTPNLVKPTQTQPWTSDESFPAWNRIPVRPSTGVMIQQFGCLSDSNAWTEYTPSGTQETNGLLSFQGDSTVQQTCWLGSFAGQRSNPSVSSGVYA